MKEIIYILTFLLFTSCRQSDSNETNETISNMINTNNNVIKADNFESDTTELEESFSNEDFSTNKELIDRLKPIKANFKKINTITKWTSIDTLSLEDESIEGGEAIFYYQNKQLQKIVKRNFGEMSQWLTEYYLLNGRLSFVFERHYQYNRHFLDKAFDFDKSEIIENRSYFENGKLLHQINSHDQDSQLTNNFLLDEQKRIQSYFNKLIKLKPNG